MKKASQINTVKSLEENAAKKKEKKKIGKKGMQNEMVEVKTLTHGKMLIPVRMKEQKKKKKSTRRGILTFAQRI